jgi:hypothetical protein
VHDFLPTLDPEKVRSCGVMNCLCNQTSIQGGADEWGEVSPGSAHLDIDIVSYFCRNGIRST